MRRPLVLSVLLHLGYWVASVFGAVTITGMHGSNLAFALLWSFSAMQPLEFGVVSPSLFFLLPLLQIAAYQAAWIVARSWPPDRRRWAFSLPALHLLGSLICWTWHLPHRGTGPWATALICLAILGCFWWLYLRPLFPPKKPNARERLTILTARKPPTPERDSRPRLRVGGSVFALLVGRSGRVRRPRRGSRPPSDQGSSRGPGSGRRLGGQPILQPTLTHNRTHSSQTVRPALGGILEDSWCQGPPTPPEIIDAPQWS